MTSTTPLVAGNPLAWLLGSALVAILATNLLWLPLRRRVWQPFGAGAVLPWVLTSLYLLLPPVMAWQRGVISGADLGVTEIEWLRTLDVGAPLALLLALVLLGAWLIYWRASEGASGPSSHERLIRFLRGPLDGFLLQWHWTFYRALAVAALAQLALVQRGFIPDLVAQPVRDDPFYWGCWLGMLVAAVEWLLNPFARAALRTPGAREIALRTAALALATTGLFLLTRNFWLCALCHIAVELFGSARPAPAASRV